MKFLPLILICLTGCAYVKTADTTVITVGTGRRTITVDKAVVSHSEIPDTLRASGELVGSAVKASGYGGPR